MKSHLYYLNKALEQALIADEKEEVPIGAIIVKNNIILAKAYNQKESKKDPTAHAELLAIQKATKKQTPKDWRLDGCLLYTTLEPCPMCAGVILQARIKTVIYAARDKNWGADKSKVDCFKKNLFNHNTSTIYLPLQKSSDLLKNFFKKIRKKKKKKTN